MKPELYGLSAQLLADLAQVHTETAKRWKRTGRIPHAYWVLAQLRLLGDLGTLSSTWSEFRLIEDRIWTPEGAWVPPGDIRAIPYTRELVRELKRQLAEPQQWKLF